MNTIGISIKPQDERAQKLAAKLCTWLSGQGKTVLLAQPVEMAGDVPCASLEELAEQVELMVVLGGDGTLLHVARRFIGSHTPILGINLGRLGFLTEAPVDDMFDALDAVLNGRGIVVRHISLKAESWRGGELLNVGYAVNDVVLQRNEHPRMIAFEVKVGGHFMFNLRADGLVLATPAGSTAYAMSAGGPIVHPALPAISVVPVCPHILSNRPVVVPNSEAIEVVLTESPAPAALNLDGQEHLELEMGDRVLVETAGEVSLVYLPGRNYFQVLRSKLHWGGPASEQRAD
jgi:NAD+ kinase